MKLVAESIPLSDAHAGHLIDRLGKGGRERSGRPSM